MFLIGHDPGVKGGLVFTQNGRARDWLMLEGISTVAIYEWICEHDADGMISEKVMPMGRDTPTTAWKLSQAETRVVSAARIADLPIYFAPIQKWQHAIFQGVPKAKREQRISATFAFARERQPAMADVLKLKKNEGLASAVCIAEYGWRLHNHNRLKDLWT